MMAKEKKVTHELRRLDNGYRLATDSMGIIEADRRNDYLFQHNRMERWFPASKGPHTLKEES